ncbi:substrate-binding domain-containing protein [Planctomycetota bacterium]
MSSRRIALRFRPDRMDHAAREIVRGIHRYAEQVGNWRCDLDNEAGDGEEAPYDGVITPASAPLARRLQHLGIPAVAVGTHAMSDSTLPHVAEGRRPAGRAAARHLVDRGYRSFGYVGIDFDRSSRHQEVSFRRTLRARGHGCDIIVFKLGRRRREPRLASRQQVIAEWLDNLEPPAGIACASDLSARMVAQAALDKGLRIPDDVGIVGAGNDPLYCNWPPCPLTSIDFDYEAVGRRAARLLDHLIDGGVPPTRNIYIEPRLVPRASTDRRFRHDPLVADALAWIAAHCHEPIRVAHVAKAVGTSERHLRRRLKRVRDRTVRQEIVLARLARARDILAATALPQAEVARACGFASKRAFARAFRRYHGAAPGACRDARPDAPKVPDPLEVAKHRLATRNESMSCVAFFSGYRTTYRMRQAFWLHEHMSPREWRKLHRQPPPDLPGYTVTITFIGPTGEIEDQQITEVPAGRPARSPRHPDRDRDDGPFRRDRRPRPSPPGFGPVTVTFIGPDGEVMDDEEETNDEGSTPPARPDAIASGR